MKHILQIQEIKEKNKKSIVAFMQENGIEKVVVEFDGSGDSGQMERSIIYPSSKEDLSDKKIPFISFFQRYSVGEWTVESNEVERSFDEAIEDFSYSILEDNHGGWEINDGSYGEIIINANGSGRIEFNQRVMETEFDETEF